MPALMGAIVLMYLYDSALLLYHDEVAFEARKQGVLVAGGCTFELGGRQLFVPNPFLPHRPLYRLSWLAHPPRAADGKAMASLPRLSVRLSVLVPWNMLLFALFAIGLPACLWLRPADVVLLGWLVTTYAVILAMLVVVFAHRRRLALTNRQIGALARDTLLCPPFALNLLRRLSLEQSGRLDLRSVIAGAPAREATVLARVIKARIATSLAFAELGGREDSALRGAQEFYGRFGADAD